MTQTTTDELGGAQSRRLQEALGNAVDRAAAHSPFLRGLLLRRRDLLDTLVDGGLEVALARARLEREEEGDVGRGLRRERQAVSLAVAIADLSGAPFERIVGALSDFADRALDCAIKAAIEARTPGAPPLGFTALALGKQGSRELNYSSDIDPILLYDPELVPRRARDDPAEAAVRIAGDVVRLLQTPTADGYVLRVDLRLRPASEASPLAVPVEAALAHYESTALPWERAAFIRARAAAGDLPLGDKVLARLRPFVWRRTLDFGAVTELQELTRRIRLSGGGRPFGPGFDIKRGRGGIREIEFFAQVHQLVHGGRDATLRIPATLDAVAALAAAGLIDRDEAERLAAAYRSFRTVEHRLQMVNDQQTHRLPDDPEALDGVARLDGLPDGAALLARLHPQVDFVGTLYNGLSRNDARAVPRGAALETMLEDAGFADAATGAARLTDWRDGQVRTTRSPAARAALERMLPALVEALGRTAAPDVALNRFDDLARRAPSAINLFHLLDARPGLMALTVDILAAAPGLSDALARRVSLLDGLIDASAFDPAPAVAELEQEFGRGEGGEDYQALLDRVRIAVGERRFALGAQLIAGRSDPLEVGAGYARVAEAAVQVLAAATVREFEESHGRVPGGELAILALGRFGGAMLTDASDLDIVYLFSGGFLAESDGPRPLGATVYFNRLAQRITAALSVPTAAGPLYAIDTRLRPQGADGLLAASVESFARYQLEDAWTWEHMALTRGRVIFGSPAVRLEIQAAIATALGRGRDDAVLTGDVVRMRGEITRHKPPSSPLDVKLIPGGLVDAEFTIHLLQLRHGEGLHPDLQSALDALVGAGRLPATLAQHVRLLTRMLIVLRLLAPGGGEPPAQARALLAANCRAADWDALMDAYAEARGAVSDVWRDVAGGDTVDRPM